MSAFLTVDFTRPRVLGFDDNGSEPSLTHTATTEQSDPHNGQTLQPATPPAVVWHGGGSHEKAGLQEQGDAEPQAFTDRRSKRMSISRSLQSLRQKAKSQAEKARRRASSISDKPIPSSAPDDLPAVPRIPSMYKAHPATPTTTMVDAVPHTLSQNEASDSKTSYTTMATESKENVDLTGAKPPATQTQKPSKPTSGLKMFLAKLRIGRHKDQTRAQDKKAQTAAQQYAQQYVPHSRRMAEEAAAQAEQEARQREIEARKEEKSLKMLRKFSYVAPKVAPPPSVRGVLAEMDAASESVSRRATVHRASIQAEALKAMAGSLNIPSSPTATTGAMSPSSPLTLTIPAGPLVNARSSLSPTAAVTRPERKSTMTIRRVPVPTLAPDLDDEPIQNPDDKPAPPVPEVPTGIDADMARAAALARLVGSATPAMTAAASSAQAARVRSTVNANVNSRLVPSSDPTTGNLGSPGLGPSGLLPAQDAGPLIGNRERRSLSDITTQPASPDRASLRAGVVVRPVSTARRLISPCVIPLPPSPPLEGEDGPDDVPSLDRVISDETVRSQATTTTAGYETAESSHSESSPSPEYPRQPRIPPRSANRLTLDPSQTRTPVKPLALDVSGHSAVLSGCPSSFSPRPPQAVAGGYVPPSSSFDPSSSTRRSASSQGHESERMAPSAFSQKRWNSLRQSASADCLPVMRTVTSSDSLTQMRSASSTNSLGQMHATTSADFVGQDRSGPSSLDALPTSTVPSLQGPNSNAGHSSAPASPMTPRSGMAHVTPRRMSVGASTIGSDPRLAGSMPAHPAPVGDVVGSSDEGHTIWRRASATLGRKVSAMSGRSSISKEPPTSYDAYAERQAQIAARRRSCQPTMHSKASIAAEMSERAKDKEGETDVAVMETFFMS